MSKIWTEIKIYGHSMWIGFSIHKFTGYGISTWQWWLIIVVSVILLLVREEAKE